MRCLNNFKNNEMIEQLLKTIKSDVGSQILEKTNLPPDKLNGIFSVIGDVTKKEVTNQMMSGDLSTVMNLFSNKANNASANRLQSGITSGVTGNLTKKLGLSPAISKMIAAIAIPAIIQLITKKNSETPDDDPSPLQEIFKKSGGLGGILGKIFRR